MKVRKSKTDTTKSIAKRLDKLVQAEMRRDNVNKTEIAKNIEIERSALVKYLSDDIEMGVNTLVKIAKHYDVSTDYLLGLSNTPSTNPTEREICKATGLSPSAIQNCNATLGQIPHFRLLCINQEKEMDSNNVIAQFLEDTEFPELIEWMNYYMEAAIGVNLSKKAYCELGKPDCRNFIIKEFTSKRDLALYYIASKSEEIAKNLAGEYEGRHQREINMLIKKAVTNQRENAPHIPPSKKEKGQTSNG